MFPLHPLHNKPAAVNLFYEPMGSAKLSKGKVPNCTICLSPCIPVTRRWITGRNGLLYILFRQLLCACCEVIMIVDRWMHIFLFTKNTLWENWVKATEDSLLVNSTIFGLSFRVCSIIIRKLHQTFLHVVLQWQYGHVDIAQWQLIITVHDQWQSVRRDSLTHFIMFWLLSWKWKHFGTILFSGHVIVDTTLSTFCIKLTIVKFHFRHVPKLSIMAFTCIKLQTADFSRIENESWAGSN